MIGALKNQIITAVHPLFLYPLVNRLTGFGHVSALQIIQHLFISYRVIDQIELKEKAVKMMGPYEPVDSLAWLIEQ